MKGEDIKAGSNLILSNNKGRIAPVVAAKVVMEIKCCFVNNTIKKCKVKQKNPQIYKTENKYLLD